MVTLSGRNRSQKSRSASSLNNYLTDFNQTCFYDIKHVLSAIAKFLVYIPGEEEGMASDGRVGKDRGRKGKWECMKKCPQNAVYLALWDTHWGLRLCHTLLESLRRARDGRVTLQLTVFDIFTSSGKIGV